MITHAAKSATAEAAASADEAHIAPVPRISIQAFCESAATASIMQAAGEDRRMGKAHLKIQMGGIAGAAGSGSRSWRRKGSTAPWLVTRTRASTANTPSGRAMTGLRSSSVTCGRSNW